MCRNRRAHFFFLARARFFVTCACKIIFAAKVNAMVAHVFGANQNCFLIIIWSFFLASHIFSHSKFKLKTRPHFTVIIKEHLTRNKEVPSAFWKTAQQLFDFAFACACACPKKSSFWTNQKMCIAPVEARESVGARSGRLTGARKSVFLPNAVSRMSDETAATDKKQRTLYLWRQHVLLVTWAVRVHWVPGVAGSNPAGCKKNELTHPLRSDPIRKVNWENS